MHFALFLHQAHVDLRTKKLGMLRCSCCLQPLCACCLLFPLAAEVALVVHPDASAGKDSFMDVYGHGSPFLLFHLSLSLSITIPPSIYAFAVSI